ncbi:MAG: hypothetical protein H7296_07160 [Bacteroidia bacterium]|nr:hypothetical protein [Bacteroidia bacterium]
MNKLLAPESLHWIGVLMCITIVINNLILYNCNVKPKSTHTDVEIDF